MADAKKLAKNTVYMYVRMILIMVVSIYTSRVVLDKLGVDDFGIYNAVASVVGMVIFLNQTLSTSSSRFLTYDLGRGDQDLLKRTFSTTLYIHLLLAGIILVLLETVGLWYMSAKFVVPDGRETAVIVVYQLSILMTLISVSIVPYTGLIIAHEDMNLYAYISIFDALARLFIVYLLGISPVDKLITYAALLLAVQLLVAMLYIVISIKKYDEAKPCRYFCRDTFKKMMSFTGWTALANLSNTFTVQGATLLLNLFFAPAIVAVKALANQVSGAVMSFVNNFRIALNPQIIKSYASGDVDDFRKLTLRSTVFSFDLILVIGLPCVFAMPTLLDLWLVEVPEYAVEFTQIAVLAGIIGTISSSTYIPFVATGRLSLNAIWGLFMGICYFVIVYLLFRVGFHSIWIQWSYLILEICSVLLLRPFLLNREIGFTYKEIYSCVWACLRVFLLSLILSVGLYFLLGNGLIQQIILFVGVFVICVGTSWVFLDKGLKVFIIEIIKNQICKKV